MGLLENVAKMTSQMGKNRDNKRTSTKQMVEEQLDESIDILSSNKIGFIGTADGCGVEELIQNVAVKLADEKTVCIVDLDECFPKLYKIFGVSYDSTDKGLYPLTISDKLDIREHILQTNYKDIYLLGFSDKSQILDRLHTSQTESEFQELFDNIGRIIDDVKSRFGVVLINIPNNPLSDYMYAGIKAVDDGFIVFNQQAECYENFYKLRKIVEDNTIVGFSSFMYAVVNNYLGIADNFEPLEKLDLNLVSILPMLSDVILYGSEGRSYIAESPTLDAGYVDGINRLADKILNR